MNDEKRKPKKATRERHGMLKPRCASPKELVKRAQLYLAALTPGEAKALRTRFRIDSPDMEPDEEERALLELARQLAISKKAKKH